MAAGVDAVHGERLRPLLAGLLEPAGHASTSVAAIAKGGEPVLQWSLELANVRNSY